MDDARLQSCCLPSALFPPKSFSTRIPRALMARTDQIKRRAEPFAGQADEDSSEAMPQFESCTEDNPLQATSPAVSGSIKGSRELENSKAA